MKFVIAPDKFKGSLTGFEFCNAVEEGLRMVFPDAEIVKMPLADGGDGTMEVIKHYLKGETVAVNVHDPLFRTIEAPYLYAGENGVAYIEMAEASGLKLLKDDERNCMQSTSLGTGELMAHALDRGAKSIILGIGGSATNDGGMGVASALGYRFLDDKGAELKPIGRSLSAIKGIDASKVHSKLREVEVKVACDVNNPLYGKEGAAHVFAAQKGATDKEIEQLDAGLRNYAEVVLGQYGIDLQNIKGAGAAGGIGGGAMAFLNGQLTSGIELIKELAHFDRAIEGSDWVITGEGRLDAQTLTGKTIQGVVVSAQRKNIPVAALCGSLEITVEQQEALGLDYVTAIVQGITTLQEAMESSYSNLVKSTYNFAKVLGAP
ncbi:glycerate kinase [Pseudozobellia thermophila]|uniref:Glycerate kinase n=1 Tax=Pseudozobellia thermophila TaxID=192903 RepID=A0A1M6C9S6_9FLAO|nr:glycerate kinase [Pseudozobellia thermophila]SHI57787.1 glycerate kinase [Pseudozobellia thermophila]